MLASALALFDRAALAQTWQMVDDFQYPLGRFSFANGLAKDPAGNLYAAGSGADSVANHAIVRKSGDNGATWVTVDDFFVADNARYQCIASDTAGNIYAGGYYSDAAGFGHCFVSRSQDAGLTWQNVDDFLGGGARSMSIDGAGNVYVLGSDSGNVPVMRKGTPDSSSLGISFSMLPSLPANLGYANGVYCHSYAGVFLVGAVTLPLKNGQIHPDQKWNVWRSQDGGASWQTVDSYALAKSNPYGYASAITADSSGNLYVGGKSSGSNGDGHWITRKSVNGGNSWITVDDFYPV